MRRLSCRIFIFSLVVISTFGCSSESESRHTHLWVGNQQQHIWSYLRVECYSTADGPLGTDGSEGDASLGEFVSAELAAGDVVTFSGGVVVKFDGTSLLVNDEKADVKHIQIDANGKIRKNAYIKTAGSSN